MSITEFLLARIGEDEAAANEWPIGAGDRWFDGEPWAIHQSGEYPLIEMSSRRVLAECKAKRAIIDAALDDDLRFEQERRMLTMEEFQAEGAVPHILALLASVYFDHSDYDREWDA